jgi:hypothetical protein
MANTSVRRFTIGRFMSYRHWALACVCVVLAGCDQISAGFTPATEKINIAFPLADELQTARNALLSSLEGDKAARQSVTEQYGKLMELRALTCTAKTPISRFDNAFKIRAKVTDTECFQKQDVRLAEWIALRRLALALAKPPLAPLADLPAKALLPNFNEYTGHVAAAAAANVMVVRGQQRFGVVQLPGGKQLGSFAVPEQTYRQPTLSANGRVLAIPVGSRSLRMVETETGNVLWNTEEYSELIAWLPQLDAAILTLTGTGAPQLMDVKNGKVEPYPATEKRLTWALSMPAANGKYLVGSGQTASLMDIARAANGALEAAPVKQWKLTGNGVSSTPFLMGDGHKIIYASSQDLNWLDMQTEQQGVWQLSALGAQGFSKLNEQAILFDTMASGATPAATRVLDITQATIATAKNLDAKDGTLMPLTPRPGYLKRSGSAVIIGSAVEMEAPQPLEPLVAEAQLARQLARLNSMTANAEQSAPGADRNSYIEALSRQVRAANTAAAIRDGLPRDVVEAIRQGRGPNSSAATGMAPGVKPLLADVPSDAKVSMIGVYEAATTTPATGGGNRIGGIRVNVMPGNTPLVLVLTSYEPVRWTINSSNRKISAILLSGNAQSSVVSPGSAQVLKIGSAYAYKMDGHEYARVKQDVARYVSNPVQAFQGGYKGQDFSVN